MRFIVSKFALICALSSVAFACGSSEKTDTNKSSDGDGTGGNTNPGSGGSGDDDNSSGGQSNQASGGSNTAGSSGMLSQPPFKLGFGHLNGGGGISRSANYQISGSIAAPTPLPAMQSPHFRLRPMVATP